jgi:hypothetical protein
MSYMTRAEAEQLTRTETESGDPGAGSYIATVLFPLVGVILAIVAFGRGKVGPGFALLLTSVVSWGVWAMLLLAMVANSAPTGY